MITYAHFKGLKREAQRLSRDTRGLTRAAARDQVARQQGYIDWGTLTRSVRHTLDEIVLPRTRLDDQRGK